MAPPKVAAVDEFQAWCGAQGFCVERMNPYHLRINDKLDVWPTSGAWHCLRSDKRGTTKLLRDRVEDYFNGWREKHGSAASEV